MDKRKDRQTDPISKDHSCLSTKQSLNVTQWRWLTKQKAYFMIIEFICLANYEIKKQFCEKCFQKKKKRKRKKWKFLDFFMIWSFGSCVSLILHIVSLFIIKVSYCEWHSVSAYLSFIISTVLPMVNQSGVSRHNRNRAIAIPSQMLQQLLQLLLLLILPILSWSYYHYYHYFYQYYYFYYWHYFFIRTWLKY